MRLLNLIGQTFGRLTVVAQVDSDSRGQARWRCSCLCGTPSVIVQAANLRSGNTTSCGCWRRERTSTIASESNVTHGMTHTPEYRTWLAVKARCCNPRSANWAYYGGRGITICDQWRNSFSAFLADMGPRPDGFSIDRINNDLGYSPENCRWATWSQQSHNNRHTKLTAAKAKEIRALAGTVTQSALAARFQVDPSTISLIVNNKEWSDR
jgi:hypothetical protein